jgi:hypothetical protein
MNLTEKQTNLLKRVATSPDGQELIILLEEVVRYYSDIRLVQNKTMEEFIARQLASSILDNEIISRLKKLSKNNNNKNQEEYE